MRLLFVVIALALTFHVGAQRNETQTAMLRHVVLFKFKDSSSPAEVKKVTETFVGLYGKVPQIKRFEWGINNSPENFTQGFTHCFTLSFSSEKDLADYQLNPAHTEFQKVLKPHMEKVFVVDYWVK